jgi:transcriptional regulator with XRE-family HTH domain
MPESFGARLRKQREERGIDLNWIAEDTKIKRSLLEGLERDDVSRWPSGIFRRAYLRTYAQVIGLDPDVVLREFLELHPDPVDVLEAAAAAASEEAARRNAAPGLLLRTIVDSAIGSLARLRRPGAIDGTPSAGPPLRAPGHTVLTPAVAPHGSATPLEYPFELEYAPELEAAPEVQAAPELEAATDVRATPEPAEASQLAEAPVQEDEAQEDEVQEDAWEREEPLQTRLAHDAATSIPAPECPQPPPALLLDAANDEREQAISEQEFQGTADVAAHEPSASFDSRLEAVALLCTEFGRARSRNQILILLEDSARALDATGLIVWLWDESADALRPALVHGYSDHVLAHLPAVARNADNATAEAFRTASPCEVAATAQATGALVVPLLIPEGCAGVLAVELQPGNEARGSVRALATLLAAALAQFVHRARPLPSGRTRIALRS